MSNTRTAASMQRKEQARVNAMLDKAAADHAAELDAGKPLNLKLVKTRKTYEFPA